MKQVRDTKNSSCLRRAREGGLTNTTKITKITNITKIINEVSDSSKKNNSSSDIAKIMNEASESSKNINSFKQTREGAPDIWKLSMRQGREARTKIV